MSGECVGRTRSGAAGANHDNKYNVDTLGHKSRSRSFAGEEEPIVLQTYAIVRNTLLETVRQPLYALVMVVTALMIMLLPVMSAHIYTFQAGSGMEQSAERMLADLGLSTTLIAGLILSVLATAGVISREIQEKTALTVLSKRLSRTAFVFGKYLGVASAVGLATLVNTMIVLLTLRVGAVVAVGDPVDWWVVASLLGVLVIALGIAAFRSHFRGRAWIGSFTLSFIVGIILVFIVFAFLDKNHTPVFLADPDAYMHQESGYELAENAGVTYDWEVAKGGALTAMAVLVMCSIAVAASTRLETGGNLVVTGVAFVGGLTSQFLHERAGAPGVSVVLKALARIWYNLMPNLQHFWASDALTREQTIPFEYIFTAGAYGVCYILALLFLAAFLFQRREIA